MSTEAPIIQDLQTLTQEQHYSPKINRRKAGQIERVYVCQYKKCQKAYGSYPALYTHIKIKHSNSKGSSKLPAKNLKYIKKIKTPQNDNEISTTQSTPQQELLHSQIVPKSQQKSLPELYESVLLNLHSIESIQELKYYQSQQEAAQSTEEFPPIYTLNQDILCPLKCELLQLKSPQAFTNSSTTGIAQKLAEMLSYLRPMIKQELYLEFCYFLGFFAKCVALRKITSLLEAEEDFEQIYQYIHDSIGYCTTFRFKFLKNGKIVENKYELRWLMEKLITDISLIIFLRWDEKMIPPFILA